MTTAVEDHASISCAISVTPRQSADGNQDAVGLAENPGRSLRAIIVADGIGSCAYAREAAQSAVAGAREALESSSVSDCLEESIRSARSHIARAAQADPVPSQATGPGAGGSWGTTLLVGVETEDRFTAGYLGNGAIWHLRGNLVDFSPSLHVPWTAVNYLNPQTMPVHGKEVLYGYASASGEGQELPPTVVTVNKDSRYGDLFVLCTDGIYSADHVVQGADPQGQVWLSAEATMVRLYRALSSYLREAGVGATSQGLHECVHACLDQMLADGLLEDDASVAVLVTGAAVAYQGRRASTHDFEQGSAAP